MKAWMVSIFILAVVILAVLAATQAWDKEPPLPHVQVRRGTVVRTAVATGHIEPKYEVAVRSQFSGLVGERFAKLGDYVEIGAPLVEVRREVTPLMLVQAQRAVEAAERGEEAAREYVGGEHLASYMMRLAFGGNQIQRMSKEAALSREEAEQQLRLLKEGKVRIGDEVVDTIVQAPVAGHVIDLISTPGERVIPIGSFQQATEVATIADMNRLEFRGTVDEIDVGKLSPGLAARITVGALPDVALSGTVAEVGLKAKQAENATVFDVRIDLTRPEDVIIRAGYSATAEISIDRRDNVLVLPERVIEFRDGGAFVRVSSTDKAVSERAVEVGLSDGLTIEISGGLTEGDRVLEREYPQIQ